MQCKKLSATHHDMTEIRTMLRQARNRYDNKVLEIERVWAQLKPTDYKNRKLITGLTKDLAEIDASLKEWEQKING